MKKYIFITGHGRSGTSFLTDLLSGHEDIYAGHEYIGNREFWLLSWYLGGDYNQEYLKRVMHHIESTITEKTFIDVNGRLQNCVPDLYTVFEPATVLHLVRDPRKVVRSLYIRRNDANVHLIPKARNEIGNWLDNDKFYQVCWNWARTTKQLYDLGIPLIHFEKIITDFDYCKQSVLDVAGIQMNKEQWLKISSQKVNRTMPRWYRYIYARLRGKTFVEDQLPEFKNWTNQQKSVFFEVCGPVMELVGYSAD
ncbi:MAG TPA: sulfotransferase domain-containing protein [Bacteroidia bacterium]|nr:sulfotransferase domain-containing protein [Bacteroidia bacterium]